MNHFVPDFDIDDDYVNVNPNSSSMNLPTKPIMGEEEEEEDGLMELLWHNGQVVLQNQRLNNPKKPPPSSSSSSLKPHGGGGVAAPLPQQPLDQNLFIQEDEMTSWLQCPLREDDFCSDLLFSASAAAPNAPSAATSEKQTTSQVTASRPPIRNFMNFSRLRGNVTGGNGRGESTPSVSKAIVRGESIKPSDIVSSAAASESGLTRLADGSDSRVTTVNCGSGSAVVGGSAYSFAVPGHNQKGKAVAMTAPASKTLGTSFSVASKREIELEKEKMIVDDSKRKEREETECPNEETKQGRGCSTSTKRSRAAEVHNLSERKRRDRINERMKALQELIPRCNKSDKASMLDEAIEYMKSLQLQIQMMSMGCGMMPMMYPGMQQYMPHMAMSMNQPLPPHAFMPFPNMLTAQRPTHLGGSRPHYPSRVYVPNQQQSDPTASQPQYPGYMDPYQQFRSLHQTQPPQFQNQATSSSRVSSSKKSEDQGNHTTG